MVKVAKARATIVREATKLVRYKEAQIHAGKDILSLMISENRKSTDEKLAEMELVDQVMTFLLAGHETTSTAVRRFRYLVNVSYAGDCMFFRNVRIYRINCVAN